MLVSGAGRSSRSVPASSNTKARALAGKDFMGGKVCAILPLRRKSFLARHRSGCW